MKADQVKDAIGKTVTVNGFRDLGIDPDMRRIIGQECVVVKQCKSGLVQIKHGKSFYSVPLINLDLKITVTFDGWSKCDSGMGCVETGVCYAMAHGEPDQCGMKKE